MATTPSAALSGIHAMAATAIDIATIGSSTSTMSRPMIHISGRGIGVAMTQQKAKKPPQSGDCSGFGSNVVRVHVVSAFGGLERLEVQSSCARTNAFHVASRNVSQSNEEV